MEQAALERLNNVTGRMSQYQRDYEAGITSNNTTSNTASSSVDNLSSSTSTVMNTPPTLPMPDLDTNSTATNSVGFTESTTNSTTEASTTTTTRPPPNAQDINKMVTELTTNPNAMSSLMDSIPDTFSPDMVDQVKKVVSQDQIAKMQKQMKDSGIDHRAIRSQIVQKQSIVKGMVPHSDKTQTVLLITINKIIKAREFPKNNFPASVAEILKTKEFRNIDGSLLAQGIWKEKKVKIYYDPNNKTVNKRMKKLVKFPIGGDVIIYLEDENIDEEDFLKMEKYITA